MAATMHQPLPSFGFAKEVEEEDWNKRTISTSGQRSPLKEYRDRWDNPNRNPSAQYAGFKHPVTREPPWVAAELRNPNSQANTFLASIRTCTRNKDLVGGTSIHEEVMQKGSLEECAHALVVMYAKCGELVKAKDLLLMHKSSSNVVAWTALIAAYAREGHGRSALDCFEQMQKEGVLPDVVTYVCSLKACAMIGGADKGKQIHDEIAREGLLQSNIMLGNALVDMYAKCGAMPMARRVLDGLPSRDVVSWNALITGYVQCGHAEQALICFEEMKHDGMHPTAVTYACILKACGMIGAADKGNQIHEEIAKQGLLQNDVVLGNALIDMYIKCNHPQQALNCFEEMQSEGIHPDVVTFLCILKACAMTGAAARGKQIHDEIARQGLLENNVMLGNALVDMYAKIGAVSKARCVLDGLPLRNIVSWNALIAGYVQGGHTELALSCFEEMRREGVRPNAVTYACILKACAMAGAVGLGQEIHDEIAKQGLLQHDVVLGNALIDMYAKCRAIPKARQVLDSLPSRNVVSWNALVAGYVQEGHAEQALGCFEEMQREGIAPDAVICACVLNGCNHQGLVEEGQSVFVSMSSKYGVKPSLECYVCMLDLLGRAGQLEKAVRLIQDMPSTDYAVIWYTLLAACRKWADVNVGRWAFERAVNWDRSDGPAYGLMADIYVMAGMGQKAESIEALRIRNRAWKKPRCGACV